MMQRDGLTPTRWHRAAAVAGAFLVVAVLPAQDHKEAKAVLSRLQVFPEKRPDRELESDGAEGEARATAEH